MPSSTRTTRPPPRLRRARRRSSSEVRTIRRRQTTTAAAPTHVAAPFQSPQSLHETRGCIRAVPRCAERPSLPTGRHPNARRAFHHAAMRACITGWPIMYAHTRRRSTGRRRGRR
eukprot:2541072-Prymnesium_polylepis.1